MRRPGVTLRPLVLLLAACCSNVAFGQNLPTITAADWEHLLPSIRSVLKGEFPNERVEELSEISIERTVDVTGDGIPAALVHIGPAGAYTAELTVMRLEDSKPVTAIFRQKEGKTGALIFLEGSSVRHGEAVTMRPKEHVVFSGHWSTDDSGKVDHCTGEAYKWSPQAKIFNFSRRLTSKIIREWCSNLRFDTP